MIWTHNQNADYKTFFLNEQAQDSAYFIDKTIKTLCHVPLCDSALIRIDKQMLWCL
jgi:hypothetical protein